MANQESLDDEPGEQAHHDGNADKAELLGDDCQQKIGMRLGQIEQLLHAAAQPQPQPFAAAESNQRVRQLVALAIGVGKRVHETEDALHPVFRGENQQGKSDQQHQHQPGEDFPVQPTEEQDAHGDRHNDHEGAEIGLIQQQRTGQHHHRSHRQEALLEIVHEGGFARGVVGGIQYGEKLHQLGRLQVGEAERYPAATAVDLASDAGDQHHHQQQQSRKKKKRGRLLPYPHRHLKRTDADAHTQCDEDALPN